MSDVADAEEKRSDITLVPVILKGEVLLYDIYVTDVVESRKLKWLGSRRTIAACALFLGMPELVDKYRERNL